MRSSTTTTPATDGTPLFVRTWLPDDEPVALVQLAHGMAEHSARYEPLARDLTDAGYAVWIHDHRGHGETSARREDHGYFADGDGWGTVVEDLHTVAGAARGAHPGLAHFLVAHSMGSLLGRDYVSRHGQELAGAAFSGTGGDPGALGRAAQVVARLEARLRGRRHPSPLMSTLVLGPYNKRFAPARTDVDWLSRDDEVVDAYVADPRCGETCTSGFYADLLGGVNGLGARVSRVPRDLPVYFFSGSEDPVGGRAVEAVAQSFTDAGVQDVTCRIYEGARHEVLNETNRDEVVADLVTWLDAHRERVASR